MGEIISYRFDVNEKQNLFHDTVMKAAARVPGYEYRYLFYGGGIRGGKSFVCFFILHQLAKLYPGSRWYIIREDNGDLKRTSIPSFEKLIGKESELFKWKMSTGDTQIIYRNGSRILFKSENFQRDKNLNEFLGLEMNGCLLEQMEGLSEDLYTRVIERLGSWYIDPMPIPLLMGTFNPTPGWVKKRIYDKYTKGELQKPFFYQPGLAKDNTLVTQDQWDNWGNLDPESNMVMVDGIWHFKVKGNRWAYSFSEERNVKPATIKDATGKEIPNPFFALIKTLPVVIVFDFNVDPMTCLICQYSGRDMEWGRIINEYRLPTSDIWELCERLKTEFGFINSVGEWVPNYYLVVTGDASGRNRNAGNKGARSNVEIIVTQLNLSSRQNQFPSANPSIKNTRTVINSLFAKHPNFYVSSACVFTIDDLLTITTDEHGEIDEKLLKKEKLKGHLLANVRYFGWNYFRKWIRM